MSEPAAVGMLDDTDAPPLLRGAEPVDEAAVDLRLTVDPDQL